MEQEKELLASTGEQDYNPLKDLVAAKGGESLEALTSLYQQIEEKLIESGGLEEFGDQMSAVEQKIEGKLDNCKGLLDYWKGQVAYLDTKAKMYNTRKTGIKNGIEWLRQTMKSALLVTGKEKVKTNEGTYYFTKPKSPVKIEPEKLTEKYQAALKKLGLKTHKVVITIPAHLQGLESMEGFADELCKTLPGSSWSITEPEYDLEGIVARWSQGNRRWPAWLIETDKTFTIR